MLRIVFFILQILLPLNLFASSVYLPADLSSSECHNLATKLYASPILSGHTEISTIRSYMCLEANVLQLFQQNKNFKSDQKKIITPFTIDVFVGDKPQIQRSSNAPTVPGEFTEALAQEISNFWNSHFKRETEDADLVKAEIYKDFQKFLALPDLSINSLITAMALTQSDPAVKGQIFSAGSISNQLNVLNSEVFNHSEFEKNFNPTKVKNLPPGAYTSNDIIELIKKVNTRDLFIVIALSSELSLQQEEISNFSIDTLLEGVVGSVQSLASLSPKRIVSLAEKITNEAQQLDQMQLAGIVKSIKSRFRIISVSDEIPVEDVPPSFQLVGVPPYMGVYRGCVSGDCSTSNSWAYPYSPYEYIFYIMKDGRNLGYASVTRTKIDGRWNLYLKDLAGSNLSTGIAIHAMHAFSLVKSQFNAKTMSIANRNFTARENHTRSQVQEYSKYNSPEKNVTQTFPDSDYRDLIANNVNGSTSGYDTVSYHEKTVPFSPDKSILSRISVKVHPSPDFLNPNPLDKDDVVLAINRYLGGDKTVGNSMDSHQYEKFSELMNNFKNSHRIRLSNYYKYLEDGLADFNIKLSGKLIEKYPHWFIRGHLLADDAFDTEDKTLSNRSTRFLSQVLREGRNLELLRKIGFGSNAKEIFNRELLAKDIDLFISRNGYTDWLRLYELRRIYIKEVQAYFSDPEKLDEGFAPAIAAELKAYGKSKNALDTRTPILKDDVAEKLVELIYASNDVSAEHYLQHSIPELEDVFNRLFMRGLTETQTMQKLIFEELLRRPDFYTSSSEIVASYRKQLSSSLIEQMAESELGDLSDEQIELIIQFHLTGAPKIKKKVQKNAKMFFARTRSPYAKAYLGYLLLNENKDFRFSDDDLDLMAQSLDNEKAPETLVGIAPHTLWILKVHGRIPKKAANEVALTALYDDDKKMALDAMEFLLGKSGAVDLISKKHSKKLPKRIQKLTANEAYSTKKHPSLQEALCGLVIDSGPIIEQ